MTTQANGITSTREVNRCFWREAFGGKPRRFYGKTQNELPADVRMAYCDFIEMLAREGDISSNLRDTATLY